MGLTEEQMPLQARIVAIADIFEALTAKDRPYKPGKTLSESLEILGRMALENHIDSHLFDVFIREKVYLKYAEQFLDPELRSRDLSGIAGFRPYPNRGSPYPAAKPSIWMGFCTCGRGPASHMANLNDGLVNPGPIILSTV